MKTHAASQNILDFPRFTFNPKEGIDNPALNINDDDEQVVVPRLLHLHRIEGQSFGFSLRWDDGMGSSEGGGPEGGLEVSVVQPFGQAEQCGLRLGDRILEVNEEDVINTDFNKVVRKIKFCGCHLFLLVLRKHEYEQAVSSDLDLKSLVKSFKGENFYRPKLCHIKRDPEHGLGFNLITLEGHRGQFIVSTDSRGPAERAGVCSGDKLIWINGTRASSLTQSTLNRMMRKNPDSVTLLVINSVSEECFIKRKMHIVPEVAECRNFPHKARTMNLAKGKDGYGFLLRQERIAFSDRTVHVLREVDSGSPAEEAGMEDGDLLLAVNSEPVESMEHEEIVKLIRQSGDRVSLTVLSMSARDFYRQLGIPPLLFHQDLEESCNENVTQNQMNPKVEVFL
ncbi:Na(+)/H(+) exchange regulatory cofactor NHE-RF4-like [Periophthalmus magnuspinnatus]|uniref:Na(+)/H(+) exchange regulatory cofactor NHE-RF4-like n=1 Tax=Periophthalmus magnuspinnatus TaxID=409849 RepID=UPI00145AB06B|nr:Na(+)/H(+) exchange regulatory cofactor NHE-RF4-like [Periophthalmus magnuspinnatus]